MLHHADDPLWVRRGEMAGKGCEGALRCPRRLWWRGEKGGTGERGKVVGSPRRQCSKLLLALLPGVVLQQQLLLLLLRLSRRRRRRTWKGRMIPAVRG